MFEKPNFRGWYLKCYDLSIYWVLALAHLIHLRFSTRAFLLEFRYSHTHGLFADGIQIITNEL